MMEFMQKFDFFLFLRFSIEILSYIYLFYHDVIILVTEYLIPIHNMLVFILSSKLMKNLIGRFQYGLMMIWDSGLLVLGHAVCAQRLVFNC